MSALAPALTRFDRPAPKPERTATIAPWKRTAGRQVCRAHVRLGIAPDFCAALAEGGQAMAPALSSALGTPVQLVTHLSEFALRAPPALAPFGTWACFELSACHSSALVELDSRTVAMVLRHTRPAPRSPRPGAQARSADERTLAWLFLEMLAAVSAAPVWRDGFRPRLVSLHSEAAGAEARLERGARHLCVEVQLALGGQQGRARVLVPGRAVEAALLRSGSPRGRPPVSGQALSARIPAQVLAGPTAVPLGRLLALRAGDLLPVPGAGWHRSRLVGAARLRTARFEAQGLLGPRGLELALFTEVARPPEVTMSDDASLSLLPVEVEVELTRLSLPLSQVATLRPGAVLPLRQSDADPVTLRIGGRAIARAELVDVEGEVGARILHLVDDGAAR